MQAVERISSKFEKLTGRDGAVIAASIPVILVAIILGVNQLLSISVNNAIRQSSAFEAREWANLMRVTVPRIQNIVRGVPPTPEQVAWIENISNAKGIFKYKLFDEQGRMKFAWSRAETANAQDIGKVNPVALEVARKGVEDVSTHDGRHKVNRPDIYAEVYIPAKDESGLVIGVVEFYLDQTANDAQFRAPFRWLIIALPIACALSFGMPALAFLFKARQAGQRDREVRRLARHDPLTGTLNRRALTEELEKLFNGQDRRRKPVGLYFIDIDHFKSVNDEFGHEFGDKYICHVSSALATSVRETDLVGRMGGDEMIVVLPDVTSEELATIGARILSAVREPCEYNGKSYCGSVSLGAHVSAPGETADEALHAADLAVYHAKSQGRGCLVEYFADLDVERLRRLEIEAQLRRALEGREMELCFQPLLRPSRQRIVGFEALARLRGDSGKMISPAEFIPVAESTGMIREMGILILEQAIQAARTWPDDMIVAVNLSPAQFTKGDLVGKVSALLERNRFPAARLELEVTESLLLEDEERVSTQLVGLRNLGVSIAMDDFGTGYSSLGYLWKYQFDKLKVDRVFLEGFDYDPEKYREIIETIVVLGHKMGMSVTVEGVESETHADFLKEIDCDLLQGFLYGSPMSASAARSLAAKGLDKVAKSA